MQKNRILKYGNKLQIYFKVERIRVAQWYEAGASQSVGQSRTTITVFNRTYANIILCHVYLF